MKKVLSILLGFVIILTILPAGTFTVSANEDISYSHFFSVEENYYEYIEHPNASAQSDYSGAVQAISNAITGVVASLDITAYGILTSQIAGVFSDIRQNPAFYYFKGYSYDYNTTTNIVRNVFLTYYYNPADIQQMKVNYEAAVTKALSCIQSGMSSADKALAMHDYLVLNCKYDYANYLTETIPHISHTAYGILVLGVGVCDGYAYAYKDLLTRLGISVIKLSSRTMSHAWNMVYLGGSWYHVDVTWDDPVFSLNNDYDLEGRVGHTYFLLSDTAITNLNHSGWLPNNYIANSTIYDGDYTNIYSGMFYNGGYWYYNTGGNLTRSPFNLSSSSVIKAINYSSRLGVYNNKIYYSYTSGTKSYIRKINFDGTADTAAITIDNTGSTVTEKITEFVIRNDILRLTVERLLADGSKVYEVRQYYPPPDIYGITDNSIYNTNVTITFSSGTALLNGNAFSNGSTVSVDGSYTIRVTATNGSVAIMYFTIDKTAPTTPTLFANPTAPTNSSVSVTIIYPADAATKEYKVGVGTWTAYTRAVTLASNDTVYARGKDAAGNISNTGSIIVGNIDKTAPAAPTFTANPTTPVNSDVTVTITYPADTAVKEYKIGSGAWTAYSAPVRLSTNNTVYARATDAAGNVSSMSSLVISNIDKVAPARPTLSAGPTTPTNGDVTITVLYPADAAVKEFKIGNGDWSTYTGVVILTSNNSVYARCSDEVGNISSIGSIIVSNIDKIAPTTPILEVNPTSPTNGDITVTIFYPTDATTKEYKIGTDVWSPYTVPLILTANDTVYARCTDAAGNLSIIGQIVVGNIDTIPPAEPTLDADQTMPTNSDVTITIYYPVDAAMKMYRIGTGSWNIYTEPVVLMVNNTVYARAIDAAGNSSNVSSIVVSNIDKTAPAVPTLAANPTKPINGDVTVTISYPSDASIKEFKIGSGDWSTYNGVIVLTSNDTVYARCTDAAGNISVIGSIFVSNIDKTAPTVPTLVADLTTPTNGDVTITISYPADAVMKEYKIGTEEWFSYTVPLILTANDTVYARCTDAAGNLSIIGQIVVGNIDTVPPAEPTLDADQTMPTNSDVTITIYYPVDAAMKMYRIGTGSWNIYTEPVVLMVNSTVYARAIDAAGNSSNVSSIVVSNIDKTAPAVPTLAANPTKPINGDVTVTISYPSDASIKEFKIGSGDWSTYNGVIVLTSNDTVYARCADAVGNLSNIGLIVVCNIYKTPPADPTFEVDSTTPTNGDVTVTIFYPADISMKIYRIGDGGWAIYSVPIVLTANSIVYAIAIDAAGNSSNSSSIVVDNIDKNAPDTPTFVPDPATPTNGDVTIIISYPADAAIKEYKIGTGMWIPYTGAVVLISNDSVFARCMDKAGNISDTGSIIVSNIDKVVPTAPSLTTDSTTPTNCDVTVTISYPVDAATKEYRIGDGTWIAYAAPVILVTNNTVYARATDAAGNTSGVAFLTVSNIDKTAPATPTLVADPVLPTNGDVTVIIYYPDDAATNEYRLHEGTWTPYTGPVMLSSNDTVYARCADSVGNISDTATIVINNIDKVVPATPDLEVSSTTPTNDDVSVTISYPDDATVKEFRIGTGEWEIYAGVVTLNLNDTVYARCTDEAGNTSSTGSIVVSNIDKTAPAAPTLVADTTAPTNGNVTIRITYPIDGMTKEFRIGNGNWAAYAGDIVLNSNETVFARCSDAVGNISTTAFLTVGNICKLVVRDDSTAIINQTNSFIYGLEIGLNGNDFEKYFVQISGNARVEYEFVAGCFGTGTKVKLVDKITQEVLVTYTILIFGDVNGDGNIDAIDAGVLVDYENSTNSWDALADAAQYKASDVNGDGNIDSIDAGILVDIENNLKTINQATGLAA